MNELISIIVPIYNAEQYLARCVNSIINQTYKNIEIVLVNDGSQDSSGVICDEFADKDNRIKAIHISNKGVSHARNVGIDNTSGNYIQFVDSDDYIEPNMVELLVKYITDHDVDLIICGHTSIDANNNLEERARMNDAIYSSKNEIYFKLLDCRNSSFMNPPWNKLYKSNIIKTYNIRFDENISLGEDFIFNLNYTKYIVSMATLDLQLYNYWKESNISLTTKYRSDNWGIMRLWFIKYKELLNDKYFINKYENQINGFILKCIQITLSATFNSNNISKEEGLRVIESIMKDDITTEALKNIEPIGLNSKIILFCFKKKEKKVLAIYYWLKHSIRRKNIKLYMRLKR
ncbi:glycosyltransferase involved in cell wall biosynthesis [Paenibacillus castaneae]|uniref:glycosyltransferase n=1 Tax=Paenibacillus castaneae TaxID=474957 RepID=UPI00141BCF3E|nr:glycosyltransferase family 2 protein [Paenibacillus castaneae]NIK78176.1 glycosyltransferase involved in cell wall biosynthesis [Paenibacillus castaneae]